MIQGDKRIFTLVIGATLAFAIGGCASERVRIISGTEQARSEGATQTLSFALKSPTGSTLAKGMTLTLIATFPPPTVDGHNVQCTDVAWSDSRILATYNKAGKERRGALQIIDASTPNQATVLQQAIFPEGDANRVTIQNDKVFVAGSDELMLATLDIFSLSKQSDLSHLNVVDLPSYQATMMNLTSSRAFVTSGDRGGLHVFDITSPELPRLEGYLPVDDARYVTPYTERQPVDIIWAIDQSGSMRGEIEMIRQHMNEFSAEISRANVDHRVILVAARSKDPDKNEICIPEPLAGPRCGDGSRFMQIDQHVDSHDALEQIERNIGRIEAFLRPGSKRHIVVVSDDTSKRSAKRFDRFLSGRDGFDSYSFHSIVGKEKGRCAAGKGETYLELSAKSDGLVFDICDSDWADLFARLGRKVSTVDEVLMVSGSPGRIFRQSITPELKEWPGATAETLIQGADVGAPTWGTVVDDTFYVSADSAGVLVFKVGEDKMTEVKLIPTPGNANGIALSDDRRLAFMANGDAGLVVMDVLDAEHARILATFDLPDGGSANSVAVSGDLIALADGAGGLRILRYALDD